MNKNSFTLSIMVPMYNEEGNIQVFYDRVSKVLNTIPGLTYYDFICVNDGSKDNTLKLLTELNQKDSRVKIINFSRNFGKEIAMAAGIDFADCDVVIPIDADLQDPPEIIPEFIRKWQEGYDVVYATRTTRDGETAMKKLTSFLFYRILQLFSNIKIPKDTGDFRLMDRKVILALRELKEYHRYTKGLFAWVGFKQIGIEYQREARFSGKTKYNYVKLINFAIEGITSFSYVPLRLSFIAGVIVSLGAFIYALFLIARTLFTNIDVPGYTSIMVAVLFLGGIQLVTLGLVGEYLGRTYNESKRRPLYLVQDAIGFDEKSS